MSIVRSLESFSLAELFKSIENESKSGRLIIETPISKTTAKRDGIYYVWFKEGHLIAVSDCLNRKGLINLIAARGWLSPLIISRLRVLCPANEPLGVYLQKMKLLSKEKLSFVFQLQLHQVYRLFQLTTGRFRFDDFSELEDRILTVPWLEMTGHKIKTTEVIIYALRLIDNWEIFGKQLPEPSAKLRRLTEQPHLKLNTIERQLWKFADAETPLMKISMLLEQPLDTIQMTAFRLMAVGLLDDTFDYNYEWHLLGDKLEVYNTQANPNNQSNSNLFNTANKTNKIYGNWSLLQNLSGILKKRITEN